MFIKRITGQKGSIITEIVMIIMILVIVGGLTIPFVFESRKRTRRVICGGNLRQTGKALYIYAREHDGFFPPTLKTLYDEHYLEDKTLMDCPSSEDAGSPSIPDYIYTAGLSVRSPSRECLVRDKIKNHRKVGKNILYVDGSVVWKE